MLHIGATWDFALAALRVASSEAERTATAAASPVELDALLLSAATIVERDAAVATVGANGRPNAAGVVQQDGAVISVAGGAPPKLVFGAALAMDSGEPPSATASAAAAAMAIADACPHSILAGAGVRTFLVSHPAEAASAAARATRFVPSTPAVPICGGAASLAAAPRHDTVGLVGAMVGDDVSRCRLFAVTSTSGMAGKAPGRVGDSALFGSGLSATVGVGAAACTGDGDLIATFPLAFVTLQHLARLQCSAARAETEPLPTQAARAAIAEFLTLPHVAPAASSVEVGVVCVSAADGGVGAWASPAWLGTYNAAHTVVDGKTGAVVASELLQPKQ